MNHTIRLFKVYHDSLEECVEEAIEHFRYMKVDFKEEEIGKLLTIKKIAFGGRRDIECKIKTICCCVTKARALVTIWVNSKGRYEVYARIG